MKDINTNITTYKRKSILSPTSIFLLILAIFFLVLGNWQMKRLDEKNSFIKKIENNLVSPASSYSKDNTLYDKIEITGKFLNDRIFLYGRRTAVAEKDGYYFLSPFTTESGEIFLVMRYWVPQSVKDKVVNNNLEEIHTQSEEQQVITAFCMPGEKKPYFTPENDDVKKIWFTLDLSYAKEHNKITNTDFYLMQLGSTEVPVGGAPLSGDNLNKIRNDHLEYAVTWYIFALISVGVIITRRFFTK